MEAVTELIENLPDEPREPEQARRRGGLWHHMDFRRLWIGETVSQFGSAISNLALPLVAIDRKSVV